MTALPALAAAPDLADRLKVTVPATATPDRRVWDAALLDASNHLRDVIGQPITAGTATLELELDHRGRAWIPISPVRAVTAVTNPYTTTVLTTDQYTVKGQSVRVGRCFWPEPPHYGECPSIEVTVDHGWIDVPGEILRLVYALAAAQIAAVSRGNLGMSGGISSISVDDGRLALADTPLELPQPLQDSLRTMYGGA